MSTLAPSISSVRTNASAWRWRLTATIARIGLAWRLATNRLTEFDGSDLIERGSEVSGRFALEEISTDDIHELAIDLYGDHPRLRALCHEAARHVSRKHESNDELLGSLQDRALEKVRDYADADGIELPMAS